MKIALAQLNYHIGNFELNVGKIKDCINAEKHKGTDLVVFSELSVCGYPPRDFLEFESFHDLCSDAIKEISTECQGIAAIVGVPTINKNRKGKRLFNSALFIADGEVKQTVNKTLLPTYDIFDEYRYFEPNYEFSIIEFKGERIALTICEDIWNVNDEGIYRLNPMDELIKQNPDFAINIAASPYSRNHLKRRYDIVRQNALSYNLPFFYVNHVGAQTELIFDGGSMYINKLGDVLDQLQQFKEEIKVYDTKLDYEAKELEEDDTWNEIYHALILGVNNYFSKLNFKKAIIGLSGGIDSALTLVLSVKALGKENVIATLLPSEFSSDHSVSDSKELCENLGCAYHIIPIHDLFGEFNNSLQPLFHDRSFDVTEENIQARIRATLLMALSNKFGYILLNTSNKSELAVGYGTLYGDMSGGLSVIGDLYKTEVYELSKWINDRENIIPVNIIEKPASAELKPDQKDSDSLPDYNILDQILRRYIEKTMSPDEIIGEGFDKSLVTEVLKLVNTSEYKRFQAPPVLRVSTKAFGMGRRMPIVGKYLS